MLAPPLQHDKVVREAHEAAQKQFEAEREARRIGRRVPKKRAVPDPTLVRCCAPLVARCAVGGTLVTSRAVLSRVLEGLSCVSMRCLRLRPAGIAVPTGAPGYCHTS